MSEPMQTAQVEGQAPAPPPWGGAAPLTHEAFAEAVYAQEAVRLQQEQAKADAVAVVQAACESSNPEIAALATAISVLTPDVPTVEASP